jgi:CDP-diglyceride synthetase
MAPDKLSRDPSDEGGPSTEGVRIIAAEELEEAAERGEVAQRRPADEPKYGDRPPAPPTDVQPAIRFPLPDSADATAIDRPRPAPVEAPRAEGSVDRPASRPMPEPPDVEVTPVSLGAEPDEPPAAPAGEPAIDRSDDDAEVVIVVGVEPEPEPEVRPDPVVFFADQPEAPVSDEPAAPGAADVRPPPPSAPDATPASRGGDAPVLDLGPSTGEHNLPHWTEPATGEVPKVVVGDVDDAEEERWASFTANATRWRDEHDTSDHGDLMADLAAAGDDEPVSERLGALDTSERVDDDAFLNFDDVELDPRRRSRRGGRRGRGRAERGAPPEGSLPEGARPAPPVAGSPVVPDVAPSVPRPPASAGSASRSDRPPLPAPPTPDEAPAAQHVPEPGLTARTPRDPQPRRGRVPRVPVGAAEPPEDDPAAPRPRRRRPPEPPSSSGASGRDLPQAIAVGAALALVAMLVFVAGPAATMVLVELVIVAAGAEYFGAAFRGGFRPATLLGLVAVAALPLAAYWRGEAAVPMILALTFVVGVLWYLLGVGGKARPTANLGVTLLGVVWVGVLGAFAALILKIPDQGVSILLVAVVATVAHDTGAFFIGRAMGRTPLSAISPNKTVEGLVGGMVATLVGVFVVVVVLGFSPFSSGEALLLGLVLAFVAPLGDLAESLFKRDLGLKDMGSLLPEHGGVLDRFDGLLFVLPAAYYVARVMGLAG